MARTDAPSTLVHQVAQALLTLDEAAFVELSTPDVSWSIPGNGRVSGVHTGGPAIIAVARTIRRHGIAVSVDQILTGRDGAAAVLHETGARAGRTLDVRVALTLLVRDDRVAAITGYLSDVDAYDTFLD
jgi:ketosteroid isomerase-like protein